VVSVELQQHRELTPHLTLSYLLEEVKAELLTPNRIVLPVALVAGLRCMLPAVLVVQPLQVMVKDTMEVTPLRMVLSMTLGEEVGLGPLVKTPISAHAQVMVEMAHLTQSLVSL
jgi:hypothetical protein